MVLERKMKVYDRISRMGPRIKTLDYGSLLLKDLSRLGWCYFEIISQDEAWWPSGPLPPQIPTTMLVHLLQQKRMITWSWPRGDLCIT